MVLMNVFFPVLCIFFVGIALFKAIHNLKVSDAGLLSKELFFYIALAIICGLLI